jgi:multiple sugar transport system permease protein
VGRLDRHGIVLTLALGLLAIVWLLPIVWVLVTSVKLTPDIVKLPPEWLPWPITGAHYEEVLLSSSRTARIGRAFANSLVVALGTAVLVVGTCAMAAYPLARLRFPGRDLVFTLVVGSLMIPNAVVLVPQYVLVQQLGWLSTFQGLIVPEAATTFAFGVFLLRQFFLTMPGELEDAARIDGANAWQVFTRVVLPLPVALALLRSAYSSESYGPIMAGAALSALPLLVVFVVANRRIVEGVRLSGMKG